MVSVWRVEFWEEMFKSIFGKIVFVTYNPKVANFEFAKLGRLDLLW